MNDDGLSGLAALEGLPDDLLRAFRESGSTREYRRGAVLLREGEIAQDLGILLGGRLSLSHRGRAIAPLERGGSYGKLSLIAGTPSLVTVTVRHDARVLHVPARVFRDALVAHPPFAAVVMKDLAERFETMGAREEREPTTVVAVHSAPAGVGKSRFAGNLAAALASQAASTDRVLLLDVATEEKRREDLFGFGEALPLVRMKELESRGRASGFARAHEAGFDVVRVAHDPALSGGEGGVAPLLSALSRDYRRIVVDLPPFVNAVVWTFLEHADVALVLSSSASGHLDQTAGLLVKVPVPARVLLVRGTASDRAGLESIESRLGTAVDEVFDELPEGEMRVDPRDLSSRYARSLVRLARSLTGSLSGLALSGGAARGTSHIGVLRCLEEIGFAPDWIAGASIGSLVGALWALGRSSAEIERLAQGIRREEFFPLTDLSLPPTPAVMRGRKVDEFLRHVFDDATFHDLRIPLLVVATDVDRGEEVEIGRGLLRDAVRASAAIPGILPPVEREGRRLVDGAVINPVPVSLLARRGVRRIVAVSTVPSPEAMRGADPALIRKPLLKTGLLENAFRLASGSVPDILDVIMRANHLMEATIAEAGCRGASVVIRPWLPELRWMDFDASPRFIEAGYHAARAEAGALARLARPGPVTAP